MTSGSSPTTHASPKLYGLDHLRALAITFVFIYHYSRLFGSPQWLFNIGKFGWTGVDLFFVLSGYLIASQLFAAIAREEKIAVNLFFIKRFFRIIPAYLLVVLLYFCFPVLRERGTPAPLWKYLTFTQNLGLDLQHQGTFSHCWSLCIEEQFYVVLPLLLAALVYYRKFKKSYWLLPALFAAGLFMRWYMYDIKVLPFIDQEGSWLNWYKWIYYPTYSRLDGLLTGVSIAALFRFRPAMKQRLAAHGNLLLVLGVLVLAGAYVVCLHEESFTASVAGFPLVSIGYGLLVMGAISPGCFLYRVESAVTSTIAALSYAIYLSHKMIIHVAQAQLESLHISKHSNLALLVCTMLCMAGAWLINKTIERPFLTWRNKIVKKKLALQEQAA